MSARVAPTSAGHPAPAGRNGWHLSGDAGAPERRVREEAPRDVTDA
jgi:hypothetical protein